MCIVEMTCWVLMVIIPLKENNKYEIISAAVEDKEDCEIVGKYYLDYFQEQRDAKKEVYAPQIICYPTFSI